MSFPDIFCAFTARAATLALAAALLSACAGGSTDPTLVSTAPAAAASSPAAAPANSPPPGGSARSVAGRGQVAPVPPPAPVTHADDVTVARWRGECWMEVEGNRKAPRDPEKRIPLVEKCMAEKTKAAAQ